MSTCSNPLDIFLKRYVYNKANNTEFTHTRIGDKKKYTGGRIVYLMINWMNFTNYIMTTYLLRKIWNI